MDTGQEDFDCSKFRMHYERKECGELVSAIDSAQGELHVSKCSNCAALLKQNEIISEMTLNLPQFDVSENLTQRIMQSVNIQQQNQGGAISSRSDLLLPLGGAASLMFVLLMPADSMQGWLAWGMGLLGLLGLQLLVQASGSEEQVVQK